VNKSVKRAVTIVLLSACAANVVWAQRMSTARECGPGEKCNSHSYCHQYGETCNCNPFAWSRCTDFAAED
jgi:hypothetical protein